MVDLSCVEHRTKHCVPLLVDMKIHFALLKLCYGAAYVPWNVPQLLLGFPLVYGVWHSYKHCVELIYRAFLPFIKFLEQGNSLQVGSILPRKVKVIHMEKTLLGLMLATSSNRVRLDERVTAADNGQSQVQSQSQKNQASTEGLEKKHKVAPKKNSTSSIKLSDWVTSTTKIKVRWDQIIIDHDRKFGQVRRISDDRVQRRYDDLKAAPPVDYIQDLSFFIKSLTRMCVAVFFWIVPFSCLNFRPCCF